MAILSSPPSKWQTNTDGSLSPKASDEVLLQGAEPTLTLRDTESALPNGLVRMQLVGSNLDFEWNTAVGGGFTTSVIPFQIENNAVHALEKLTIGEYIRFDTELAFAVVEDQSFFLSSADSRLHYRKTGVDNVFAYQDGDTFTDAALGSDLDADSNKIINLATPTADNDAANKSYVDAIKQGLDVKDSARVATTTNITLSGEQTIDGVSAVTGNRVLVKNQTAGEENGIYVVAAGAWSRSADADTDAEVTTGMFIFVSEGTVHSDSGWVLITNDPIVLGTTALTFVQFSGAGQITAGAGLTKTGNTLDVGAGDGISVAADSVAVDSSVVRETATQTLTNKTINLSSNTLSGTTAQFNTALSDGDFATLAGTETLTNKTISLGSNTITGTTAQFNTALTDGDFATLAGTETLSNKTLTAPKFADLGFIADANGNELLILDTVTSAVNDVTLANAATGNNPTLTASGETNVGLTITGKGTKGVSIGNALYTKETALTDGANIATDASLGNVFTVTIGGDRTLDAPTNAASGQKAIWRIKASGANRTLTLATGTGGFRFGTDITSLTATTQDKTDYIGAIYHATDNKWDVIAYTKGF